jgi:DNA-binding NtrC family response regulator
MGQGRLDLIPAQGHQGVHISHPAGGDLDHHLPGGGGGDDFDFPDHGVDLVSRLEELETRNIVEALKRAEGNRTQAARLLGLNRTTLVEKLKRRGIAS